MITISLKMLMGEKTKYYGMISAISFSAFLILQQLGIFAGITQITSGFLNDITEPEIWVMHSKVKYIEDIKQLEENILYKVKGIQGISDAVPIYKGMLRIKLSDGEYLNSTIIGIDENSLIGAPKRITYGKLENILRANSIFIDSVSAKTKLYNQAEKRPLGVGDEILLNDKRAIVAGICDVNQSFQSFPSIYTSYRKAIEFSGASIKSVSFILVKLKSKKYLNDVKERINSINGIKALSTDEFQEINKGFFLKESGMVFTIGISVFIAFIIGLGIVAQFFFNFIQDNLKYFGVMKAMGADSTLLKKMILSQVCLTGFVGFGIGACCTTIFGLLTKGTMMSFNLTFPYFFLGLSAIGCISIISGLFGIRKVVKLDSAIIFRG